MVFEANGIPRGIDLLPSWMVLQSNRYPSRIFSEAAGESCRTESCSVV